MSRTREIRRVSPQRVRELLHDRPASEWHLVDVRQPAEFAEGHLPGAVNLPLHVLAGREGMGLDLRRDRPVVLYCRTLVRARAAADILARAGYTDVSVLDGGYGAWTGTVADGSPEEGLFWFSEARTREELVAAAIGMERGARAFYLAAAEQVDGEARAALTEFAHDEDRHVATLVELHRRLGGGPLPDAVPERVEGGVDLATALAWVHGRPARALVEVALAMEAMAYDRYAWLERTARDADVREVFHTLAEGERRHVARIHEVLDRVLGGTDRGP